MDRTKGVVYVAYGSNAVSEAEQSLAGLRRFHDWPVLAVGDKVKGADYQVRFGDPAWGARRAKLHINVLVPWSQYLYLDADTRVHGNLSAGFDILADGWDMAITLSENQETDWLWHSTERDREDVISCYRGARPLQLQGGMFYAAKSEAMHNLFAAWRQEWAIESRMDQGALLRALHRCPVRLWLLDRAYNGGELVEHLWGRARA